ncbi:transmembrane protein 276 [Hyperolius riggenbachi]|uniref:transmembrane protein 276 n=1 Tax=Hyperolius riggenbachi TaxID=752182 RepID=UPI0035A37B37
MGSLEVVEYASHVTLSTVCLFSALRMLEVHRGASAGFLLLAVASMSSVTSCFLYDQSLTSVRLSNLWVTSIIGLPLLVFAFFWTNGDHLTANVILGSALLLASCSAHLSAQTKMAAIYLTNAGASLGMLMISVFTGNAYGVLGSLALGTGGLLSFLNDGRILPFSTDLVSDCVYGTSFLALQMALRSQTCEVS